MPPIKRRDLPSLGGISTVEVAAKHLSFTLTAKKLRRAALQQECPFIVLATIKQQYV
jgi:hypothetical protein